MFNLRNLSTALRWGFSLVIIVFALQGCITVREPVFPKAWEKKGTLFKEDLVNVKIGGKQLRLHMVSARKASETPLPIVILTHGSASWAQTDIALGQAAFDAFKYLELLEYIANQGFGAVFFSHRGHGFSEGETSKFSCGWDKNYVEKAMSVGLDFEAIHGVLSKVQWADSKNVIIGGHSTGGVGALYYAGLKPNGVIGVLNIAGTYGCTGGTYGGRNIWKTRTGWKEHVTNGNSVRQLWLYGDNDSYTAISDLKDYVGMKNIELVILNGADHHILDGKLSDLPERWKPTVSKFLNSIKGELQ